MKKLIFILLLLNTFTYKAQQIFYQDVFHGGVTGGGYTTTLGSGTGSFVVQIPSGSSIRFAYLFSGCQGYTFPIEIVLNSTPYIFNNYNQVSNSFLSPAYDSIANVHAIDITNDINPLVSNYTLTIPPQYNSNISARFTDFYLIIGYENTTLPLVNSVIEINNQNFSPIIQFFIKDINSIDISNETGFSIFTGYFCDTISDGSNIIINNTHVGLLGGNDNNTLALCGGVMGNFYYQSNQLFGLGDDNSNITMNGSDGIANISSYLVSPDSMFIQFIHQTSNFPLGYSNSIWATFLTYTTPCDTFSVSLLTENTTICQGTSVQLGASGGGTGLSKPAYEWLPTTGLSCSNCANPIASPDSTTYYTVRIWNTDSCSKVLPVRVKVLPQPQFTSIVTTPSACGVSTGSTTAVSSSSTDSLFSNGVFKGKTPQTLTNLGTGNYVLYLEDTNSCKSKDTTVTINSVNLTNALFTLNPTTGAVPLSVSSDNQSTHATDYSWYFQNDSTTITSPTFEFDTSGTYTITLIAYNNTPDCSDTFSLQIVVYDSLQLIIPNVFTPNGDNQNDVFSIQVNAPCTGNITITNRWGNEMLSKNIATDGKDVSTTLNGTKILIWGGMTDGQKASDGVYFYSLSLRANKNKEYHFQGFVELMR
ncbi:MAG: gliding motility-associated C-terminal domain-containing protein [Crocinitomicaceae bacterium]